MKQFSALILACMLAATAYGQEPGPSMRFAKCNSVQFEAFGHGLVYSLNFERVLLNGELFKTTVQAGASYYPPATGVIDFWFPLLLNELLSFNAHHAELGLGYILNNEALRDESYHQVSRDWYGFFTGRIGYRYQKPGGRYLLRIAFTPFIDYRESRPPEFIPSGGLSFGIAF